MKMRTGIVGLALIAPLSVAWGAKAVDPETMTKVPCSDLHFSKAFLDRYPQAPAACIEGRQDASGVRYGKFTAKVYLNSADRTTVQMVDAKGDIKTTFSIKPKPDAKITVNGKKVRMQDLSPGDELTFWVPESRMVAKALPSASAQSWTVLPPVAPPQK
jgi:hypothetical protein